MVDARPLLFPDGKADGIALRFPLAKRSTSDARFGGFLQVKQVKLSKSRQAATQTTPRVEEHVFGLAR